MRWLLVLVACAGVASAQPTTTVRGKVVDAQSREPVAGAIIAVGTELTATDDDGTFLLVLRRGAHTLEVTAPWIVTQRVPVVADGEVELVVEVEAAAGETIEVTGVAPTQLGETRVDAKLARAVPGGGDAVKVLQSLPAVARPPAGSAEIVVWGAAPRDTRVFVDGVPVPALYHLGGYRAAMGNDLIGDIRLAPAAFGAERGRAIGGVIDIGLDVAKAPMWRGQADPLDWAVAGRKRLGRFDVGAAARRSWLDRAVDLVADPATLAPNAPLPVWSDAQIVARGDIADRVTLGGWILRSDDALDRVLASDDPATETAQEIEQGFWRAQATVRRERDDGTDSATLWFGHDTARDDLRVGAITAAQSSRAWVGGLRGAQQTRLADRVTVTLGTDVDGEHTTYARTGSLAIPAREGDPKIFGQPPGDDVNSDRWSATTIDVAGHVAMDLRLGRITATAGGRVDGWLLGASRLTPRVGATPGIGGQQIELTIDPRASLQLRITDDAALRVDGGRYHQARAGSDTSAVFGTPDLGLEEAWHATAGGQWRRGPFALEAAGYARRLADLVARDPAVTPMLAHVLTQAGTGRVLGAQLTARVVGWRGLSGWLSYGISKSTRRDAPEAPPRYFDRDQTHGLIAVGGWEHGGWNVGGRVRVSTGEPRTGVLGAFFDSRSGRYQPIRGPQNGERLPAFFAADLRGERRFQIGAVLAAVYAEVQNLTSRANAEEIIYSADFAQKSYLTGLPLLALVGVRLEQ